MAKGFPLKVTLCVQNYSDEQSDLKYLNRINSLLNTVL